MAAVRTAAVVVRIAGCWCCCAAVIRRVAVIIVDIVSGSGSVISRRVVADRPAIVVALAVWSCIQDGQTDGQKDSDLCFNLTIRVKSTALTESDRPQLTETSDGLFNLGRRCVTRLFHHPHSSFSLFILSYIFPTNFDKITKRIKSIK